MEQAQEGPFQLAAWYGEQPRELQTEQAVQEQEAGRPGWHVPCARGAAGARTLRALSPSLAPAPALRARHGTRGSGFRGVSGHKVAYEAHVWAQRKQIFLGCYHNEELAARAYDLASIALRGPAACTNFPAQQYAAELAAPPQAIETLALALREQAKALGRPPTLVPALQPWELPLSEAVSGQASLGLFASEEEAARAVDRALLARDGLAAAPHLNFPLAGYLYLLDPSQVQQAVQQGLLPAPAVQPTPAHPEVYGQLSPFATAAAAPASQPAEAQQADSMAPPAPLPLPRRASVTPRHAGQPSPSPFSLIG